MTETKLTQSELTPDLIISQLIEGNNRFLNADQIKRNYSVQIDLTKSGQYPKAVILGCIDSRVPSEIIFDQGIGDVFNTRVAGNIINEDVLGSMEYSCKVAGSKLILVLGHTKCGAVGAACQNVELGNITVLLDKIKPAINELKFESSDLNEDQVEAVAIQNIRNSIQLIREKSEILKSMELDGEIKIVGASYDVSTGKVNFL